MTRVRVLVGTRKGAFILTSDGRRERWKVEGPHFPGWEIYHLAGSPADPNRIWASQSTSWFGQLIQRSDDGGKSWQPVGNEFAYEGVPGTHQWYDGTPHPWEFARVWHLEPSLTDPDALYACVEGEVALDVRGPVTQRTVLAALEARYPMLRGTVRDHTTHRRRAFVRFFACREDWSHEDPDASLPEAIVQGNEPFVVIGAMAGG